MKKTNEDIDYLKSYFNPNEKNFILKNVEEIFIEEKILKLGEFVKEYRSINDQSSRKIKYNSIKNNELGKEIKSLTKDIKKYLFNDDISLLYDSRKEIKNDLNKLNRYFEKLDNENNIETNIKNNSIVNKKEEYLDNYIYNSIVNHSLYKYENVSAVVKNKTDNDKITIEDLIQEIAYQNNLKEFKLSDQQRRKKVLDNYFKNGNIITMFPSKYKMEKNIKNINYEMEKASQEFSKLFNYEK